VKKYLIVLILFFISFYGNSQQQASFTEQELARKLCESFTMNFSSEPQSYPSHILYFGIKILD